MIHIIKITDSDKQEIKNYMALIGRKGGAVKSLKKQEAGRLNMAKAREARLKRQKPVKGHRIAPNEYITD